MGITKAVALPLLIKNVYGIIPCGALYGSYG